MSLSAEFVIQAQRLSRDAFAAQYKAPFLVGIAGRPPTAAHALIPMDGVVLESLDLSATTRNPGERVAAPPRADKAPLVLVVQRLKQPPSPLVSVGRTSKNDIVIDSPLISKVHAFFKFGHARLQQIYDAGSINGTYVDGRKLAPRSEFATLSSGSVIRFGSLEFLFLHPYDCWEHLRGSVP